MTDQHPTPAQAAPQSAEPIPSPTSPAGWRFETKQVQAGHDPLTEPAHARAIPIYQTSSYVFESAEQAAARFALSDLGPIYTRLNNPTNDIVEQRIAALEGGVGALLTSSGQAATTLALVTLGGAGDNIVAHYLGQTWNGDVFDSSYDRGRPLDFQVGVGMVIRGWDDGLVGQRVGSRLLLSIPSELGYGDRGVPQAGIRGGDTLVFVTEILGVM